MSKKMRGGKWKWQSCLDDPKTPKQKIEALLKEAVALEDSSKKLKEKAWFITQEIWAAHLYKEATNKFKKILSLLESLRPSDYRNEGLKIFMKIVAFHLYKMGKFAKARKKYFALLELNHEDMDTLNSIGVTFFMQSFYHGGHTKNQYLHQAINYFNKISLDKDNNFILALAVYNKGISLFNLKQYAEARQCFENVLQLDQNDMEAKSFLGKTQKKLTKASKKCTITQGLWADREYKNNFLEEGERTSLVNSAINNTK